MATSTETRQILGTTLADRIGNTPLVRLDRLTAELPGVSLLGKAEWANPGGSVKDRAASGIVGAALERGLLGGGKHLLDATSGNTGIAYAMLGAAWGFPVTLCVPSNVSSGTEAHPGRVWRECGVDRPERWFGWSDPQGARAGEGHRKVLLRRPVRKR